MIDEIVIVTPELTPGAGGVGDYTLRLLANWPALPNLRLLVPPAGKERTASAQYRVEELGADAATVLEQLPVSDGKVLVQYSAYGFGRLGYPRELIRALIDWKTKTRGLLVVMFHEIWTFWPITNKNSIVQFLHRRAIKKLLRCTDFVFTSTQSQAGHLRELAPRCAIHVLPVGSTIRTNDDVDLVQQPGWVVVFGLESTRIQALQKMQDSLRSLASAGRIVKIITAGARVSSQTGEKERKLLTDLGLKAGFEQKGPLPEREVSRLLLTASFGISGQDELSYAKSTIFMAYAAHGLNILAPFADAIKPEPICLLTAPDELLCGISETKLKERAERLREWQKRTSSWDKIAARFAEAFNLREPKSAFSQTASS